MNRRSFTQALATAALSAAAPSLPATPLTGANPREAAQSPQSETGPFGISIMLWTVYNKLPFEQRLEKVAEAGYTNVELVGEYKNWSADDFTRANAARKRLGIRFDATAGLGHGVADPASRDALVAGFTDALKPMETLGIPAMIVLSGNVIPGLSREQQHESCIESLKRMAAAVEGKQIEGQPVKILLECIDPEENPHIYLSSAAEAMEIVHKVNHPQVRFLYDMFHEQIAEGNLIEKLEKNIDVIDLLHIADVPGRHEPGTGEINYMSVYRKLGQLKYKGMVAMEFYPTGDPVAMLRQAKHDAWAAAAV
jgi:hydroxypyruvate isomerase